jgi:hypothetical protein
MRDEMRKSMLLNNFLGAIWALQMLKPSDYAKSFDEIFNWSLLNARIEVYKLVKKKYF